MKIALAQLNCHIGNFSFNADQIVSNIQNAKAAGADLIVFPELAVCGYPPMDLLDSEHFITQCEQTLQSISKICEGIVAIVGCPSRNPSLKGKNLFNSAFLLKDGQIQDVFHKTLLPTYDVFDEYRYFEPNSHFRSADIKGLNVAITICEDLWNEEEDPMYRFSPLEKIENRKIDLVINIAASPFDHDHREKRIGILKRNALKFDAPIIYVNHTGGQNDLIFDGGSLFMDANGSILHESPYFCENLSVVDIRNEASMPSTAPLTKPERTKAALVLGIRDYFNKCGFTDAVLGLSGGVDSALVAVLAKEALGPNHVHPVLMPSAYSSQHSIDDAVELCKMNGLEPRVISIKDIYDGYLSSLHAFFEGKPFDITEENIQSRIRGTILMALSNKHRYVLLNTSNKSELAVGYGTLYGDMAGGLSVIGDLYKTEVYELCGHINHSCLSIPENILTKEPSAELRPGQKDSDSLPPYELLDQILFMHIEGMSSLDQINHAGFDQGIAKKILGLVNRSEYKRFQFAPILRVSTKAFGTGRRFPLVAAYQ